MTVSLAIAVLVILAGSKSVLGDIPSEIPHPAAEIAVSDSDMKDLVYATLDEAAGYNPTVRKDTPGISDRPEDVHFYIYPDPYNSNEFHEIHYGHERETRKLVESGVIRPNAHWKFLIHGFLQAQNSSFPHFTVKQYHKLWRFEKEWVQANTPNETFTEEGLNVVVVDWGRLAYEANATQPLVPWYPTSVGNVKIAGKRVGKLITWLKRLFIRPLTKEEMEYPGDRFDNRTNLRGLMSEKKVHLIGFSLGAHVAGMAGAQVVKELSRKVGRITALDPAGPWFGKGFNSGRTLGKNDAGSLDVIHTNGGGLGLMSSVGDADFYVNYKWTDTSWGLGVNSMVQPICSHGILGKFRIIFNKICSHSMAPLYFTLSITDSKLMHACMKCKKGIMPIYTDCNCETLMGEWYNPMLMKEGEYYLTIGEKELGDYGITWEQVRKFAG